MALRDHEDAVDQKNEQQSRDDIPNVKGTVYNRHIFQDPRRISTFFYELKNVLIEIHGKHEKLLLVTGNVLVVLILSACLTKMFSGCYKEPDIPEGDSILCREFKPVDRVDIEVDSNSTSHCYSSQSCVALGGSLRQQQGEYRYNFIIGAYGFVFAELGYKCRTDNTSSLVIRLPVFITYDDNSLMAPHKAMDKLVELVREGLECGLVLPNYTVRAMGCIRPDDWWCSDELTRLLNEESLDKASAGLEVYIDNEKDKWFNPMNIRRAYNFQQKLVVCQEKLK